ncbi:MAG TPA: nitroreductase/quinone reductase family protein [Ornithinibacter sp.]|nr:nitroreductase/quinone reductase family protein [Ornithinibacter sp.]
MTEHLERPPRLPPRWFIRLFWQLHRALFRVTGGRLGLWRPAKRWGTLRLTTTGRRTGQPRHVILGYLEDGPNLVTLAMNGWDPAEPAWWLNLQADPLADAELDGSRVRVTARAAEGEERARLWARWGEIDKDLDAYATRRPSGTAVVVLEPHVPGQGRA